MKLGPLALGTLVCATSLAAQPARDPLAPLPTTPPPAKGAQPQGLMVVTQVPMQPAPAATPVVVPKDWRGVFDAIDAGNWA